MGAIFIGISFHNGNIQPGWLIVGSIFLLIGIYMCLFLPSLLTFNAAEKARKEVIKYLVTLNERYNESGIKVVMESMIPGHQYIYKWYHIRWWKHTNYAIILTNLNPPPFNPTVTIIQPQSINQPKPINYNHNNNNHHPNSSYIGENSHY